VAVFRLPESGGKEKEVAALAEQAFRLPEKPA